MENTRIIGMGSALGRIEVSNEELSRRLSLTPDQIESKTGIVRRFKCNPQEDNLYTLMAMSAEKAMVSAGVNSHDVDGVFTGCNPTGDFLLPNVNTIVASLLGIDNFYSGGNATGCCGGLVALDMANNKLVVDSVNRKKSVYLVFGADQTSRMIESGSLDEMLFSDAATCLVVTNDLDRHWFYEVKKVSHKTTTFGSDSLSFRNEGFSRLVHNGRAIYRFASQSTGTILELLGVKSFPKETYLILHQANLRIIESMTRDIPKDCVYKNGIKDFGNTSPASVFLGLEDVTRKELSPYGKVVMASFGEGLTVAVAELERNSGNFSLPIPRDDSVMRRKYMGEYRVKWSR